MGQLSGIIDETELNDVILAEHYILLQIKSGCIEITPSRTIYLTCPSKIVKKLEELGIDLRDKKERKKLVIQSQLLFEENLFGEQDIVLCYRLRKKTKQTEAMA